jgi:ATP-binding cassette subfamily F protein 3
MNELAGRVVEIGAGRIADYPGDYEHYLWRKSRAGKPEESGPSPAKARSGPSAARLEWEERRKLASRRRRLMKEAQAAQEAIARLEAEMAGTEERMQELYSGGRHQEAAAQAKSHASIKARLEGAYEKWEKVEKELRQIPAGDGR